VTFNAAFPWLVAGFACLCHLLVPAVSRPPAFPGMSFRGAACPGALPEVLSRCAVRGLPAYRVSQVRASTETRAVVACGLLARCPHPGPPCTQGRRMSTPITWPPHCTTAKSTTSPRDRISVTSTEVRPPDSDTVIEQKPGCSVHTGLACTGGFPEYSLPAFPLHIPPPIQSTAKSLAYAMLLTLTRRQLPPPNDPQPEVPLNADERCSVIRPSIHVSEPSGRPATNSRTLINRSRSSPRPPRPPCPNLHFMLY
jgi:hypothetical protein